MTLRGAKKNGKRPHRDSGFSGWHLVAALIVIAVVIIATLLITRSPEAVTIVTLPLVTVLGWWVGRRLPAEPGE
jgi:hypothetical protein